MHSFSFIGSWIAQALNEVRHIDPCTELWKVFFSEAVIVWLSDDICAIKFRACGIYDVHGRIAALPHRIEFHYFAILSEFGIQIYI